MDLLYFYFRNIIHDCAFHFCFCFSHRGTSGRDEPKKRRFSTSSKYWACFRPWQIRSFTQPHRTARKCVQELRTKKKPRNWFFPQVSALTEKSQIVRPEAKSVDEQPSANMFEQTFPSCHQHTDKQHTRLGTFLQSERKQSHLSAFSDEAMDFMSWEI